LLVEHDGETAAVLQRIQAAQRLAREGIEETRRAVQSLRGDARPLTDTLRTLADAAGARYREDGVPWPLGPQANLTVERTVQEGLTNARKHAPGAAVTISTSFGGEQLRVEVRDTGSGQSGSANGSLPGGGYGLAGMRERAELIGAELQAGPYGKGFRVCLTLPRDAISA
jgi:signal transduction histidine kinase